MPPLPYQSHFGEWYSSVSRPWAFSNRSHVPIRGNVMSDSQTFRNVRFPSGQTVQADVNMASGRTTSGALAPPPPVQEPELKAPAGLGVFAPASGKMRSRKSVRYRRFHSVQAGLENQLAIKSGDGLKE